jgi:hypothetical protein
MKKLNETVTYESSTVVSSTYQFDKKNLIVEFIGGAKYLFEGVDIEDYLSFSTSESVGRSFNEYIKKYSGTKIENHAETV